MFTESHEVVYILRLFDVGCLHGDALQSSEEDIVNQRHSRCILEAPDSGSSC
jgi:hypothetical protein